MSQSQSEQGQRSGIALARGERVTESENGPEVDTARYLRGVRRPEGSRVGHRFVHVFQHTARSIQQRVQGEGARVRALRGLALYQLLLLHLCSQHK